MLPPTYKGHTEPVGSATYFAAYGQTHALARRRAHRAPVRLRLPLSPDGSAG